jgi:hypothetical protein
MGVNAELIQTLNPHEIRDLLKGLLYLKARYPEDSDSSGGCNGGMANEQR